MTDGRTSLVKSMETRDEHMMDLLLNADLHINYIDHAGFMYDIAKRYQDKDRGMLNYSKCSYLVYQSFMQLAMFIQNICWHCS